MKRENPSGYLQAVWLSWMLTFGALGAMVTGLNLNAQHPRQLALLWAAVCGATALSSRSRFGGWLPLAAAVGAGVYLVRSEICMEQTLDLLCKITNYYDHAYGWGLVRSPGMGTGPMDRPLAVLGTWVALANCRTLCRGKTSLWALILGVLPVAACVVVTDTVPDSLYLYLWLLALVLILLSRAPRRAQQGWGVNMVRLAVIPAALALAVLFWTVPREGYDRHPDQLQERVMTWIQELPDLWNQASEEVASFVDGTVQPESLSLDTLGPRVERVYPVMDVTSPVSGTVYLRGQHYDIYTGTGWTVSDDSAETFSGPENSRDLGTIIISTRRARDVIYLPYYPEDPAEILEGSVDNEENVKVYSFAQRGLFTHWRNVLQSMTASMHYFRAAGAASPVETNLYLPPETYTWAAQTVNTILDRETTATAAADSIAEYVRESARYDLNTSRMSRESDDFARWFLEESETGYCVHFATAAVVLLRAAGIEARYVEGYMFTAHMGQETTVTADQAHAWAEYYEPLLDTWIVLEATPADLNDGQLPQSGVIATQTPDSEPTEPSTAPREETGQPAPESSPGSPEDPKPEEPGKSTGVDGKWLRWLLIPALAVLAAELQRLIRIRIRILRRRGADTNRQALYLWRELAQLHRLSRSEPPAQARDLALKAKYSPHRISREELAQLEDHIRSVQISLAERSRCRRLLERYLLAVS